MGFEPTIAYDDEVDVLYVHLREGEVARTHSLDDFRLIDYSADGVVLGIEFIDASAGIDLRDIPFKATVEELIGNSGQSFKVFA